MVPPVSVAAVHDKLIWVVLAAVAVRLAGAVGEAWERRGSINGAH